jgi:hypothetical protein
MPLLRMEHRRTLRPCGSHCMSYETHTNTDSNMGCCYGNKVKVVKSIKSSTDKEDKENDNISRYTVTLEVTFDVWADNKSDAEIDALAQVKHALS